MAGGSLLAVSLLNFLVWVDGYWDGARSNVVVFVQNGCVSVHSQRGPGMAAFLKKSEPGEKGWGVEASRANFAWLRAYWSQNVRRALVPEYQDATNYSPTNPGDLIRHDILYVPIWLLAGVCWVPWIWERVRRMRAYPAGCCSRCGYDLRATAGRCPECGTLAGSPVGVVGE